MSFESRKRVATFISDLFNPFVLIPILQIIFFKHLGLPLLSLRFGLVIVFQLILPVIFILGFIHKGRISDFEITKREERSIYFLLLTIFFGLSIFVTKDVPELYIFSLKLTISMLLIYFVTLKWKISGHTGFDTLIFLQFIYINSAFALLLLALPAIAWSRIYLKKHTLKQTVAGALLSCAVFFVL